MFFTYAKRIIRSGYRNFVRSGFTSLAAILMMVVTLFVITSLVFVQATLKSSLDSIREKVDVTIYFVPGASEESIKNVQEGISKLPEVRDVSYTSQEQALTEFKDRHAGDYLTLQALDELDENPLGATLNIKARDPSEYESISRYFDSNNPVAQSAIKIIDKIDYHQNKVIIDRLTSIIAGAQKLGLAVSLVLILISIIITFSTIRLIIYMSREEISVMKLVGAGGKYIRGPFVVSGMLVGVAAALITIVIYLPIAIWLGNQVTDFVGVNLYNYYKENFLQLFIIMLGTGILLGSISSALAIARYLKK